MKNINVNNYSRIHIGTSTTNTLSVVLITDLELGDKFVTDPFGSNKMRFQYPEMFTYNLKKIKTDMYALDITRSDIILCSATANFFWKDGWTVELYITNIPQKKKITCDHITRIIPCNYGCVDINISQNEFKVGIIVPLFNRHKYVETFFSSLIKSDLTDCLIIFIDESMTKDVDDDKKLVNYFVKNICIDNSIKIFKTTHGNMFDSIIVGCDLASIYCDTLITIDSDTIHAENWVTQSIELYYKILQTNENLILSPFNTINANRHVIIDEFDEYYTKNSVGGCCLIFNKKLYYKLIRCGLISHKWDTNLINNIKNNNGLIIVTKPSLIEHIGIESSGHRVDNTQEYDVAIDFVRA
jgi:hypothetical protein